MKMKILLAALIFAASQLAMAQKPIAKKVYRAWWNEVHPGKALNSPNSKKLPLISVQGNKFVNSKGNTVLFRGLNISDPDKIENQGYWNKKLFVKINEMGAKLVRIPVHPVSWRERGPEAYLTLLDSAVEWATSVGVYIDIDWHSIGNLKAGLFQDPMYNTSVTETYDFWRTISKHFSGNNTVAFYELFNEPTIFNNNLGSISWHEWKEINENMIAIIRSFDNETIPLVAGFDWAYDLTPLNLEPINAEKIGYVTHPYPHKRTKPYEPKWEENFGFAASRYPIVATEIGFTGQTSVENIEYGKAITAYLEGRGISWLAWVLDPEWYPNMIESWDSFKLTEGGEFFSGAMKK